MEESSYLIKKIRKGNDSTLNEWHWVGMEQFAIQAKKIGREWSNKKRMTLRWNRSALKIKQKEKEREEINGIGLD